MDIDNNFEEFPNIEERQKDFNCSIGLNGGQLFYGIF